MANEKSQHHPSERPKIRHVTNTAFSCLPMRPPHTIPAIHLPSAVLIIGHRSTAGRNLFTIAAVAMPSVLLWNSLVRQSTKGHRRFYSPIAVVIGAVAAVCFFCCIVFLIIRAYRNQRQRLRKEAQLVDTQGNTIAAPPAIVSYNAWQV